MHDIYYLFNLISVVHGIKIEQVFPDCIAEKIIFILILVNRMIKVLN